jgi:hypothetical protein
MVEKHVVIHVPVFTPRWGHDDDYAVVISKDKMAIKGRSKGAECSRVPGRDPEWKGYNDRIGNPLVNVLENDHVYPPSVFISALERAWDAWGEGELDDEQVKEELRLLFDWVNHVTKGRPASPFWASTF